MGSIIVLLCRWGDWDPWRAGAGSAGLKEVGGSVWEGRSAPHSPSPQAIQSVSAAFPPGLWLPQASSPGAPARPGKGMETQYSSSRRGLGGGRAGSWSGSEWGPRGLFLNPGCAGDVPVPSGFWAVPVRTGQAGSPFCLGVQAAE